MRNNVQNDLVLLVFFIAGLSFQACTNGNAASDTPAMTMVKEVETKKAQQKIIRKEVVASGRLSSNSEVKLSFKTGGVIKRISVVEGQTVRQGQVLAELDLEEIDAQVAQAELGVTQSEISIRNAQLALELAERDFKNAKGLYEDSVATLEQFQNAEVQLKNARNQLEAAQKGSTFSEKNKEIAAFNRKYSKITAPANGTILRKLAEPSELIGPGMPVFFFGSQEKAMVIKVSITDKDVIYINLGDPAEVHFDAYPDKTFEGTVQEISSMADPYTNTYEVEIAVDPAGAQLLSGFIGSVRIQTQEQKTRLAVPVDALVSADGQKGIVYVSNNGRAERRTVALDGMEGDVLLISEGLKEGEEIVIKGAGYLDEADSLSAQ